MASEGFALADSYDAATGRYAGLWLPGETGRGPISDVTLIVKPEVAEKQRREDVVLPSDPTIVVDPTNPPGPPSVPAEDVNPPVAPAPKKASATRYVGSVRINAERYSGDFAKIAAEVLANLAASGAELKITLSIDALKSDGFTEQQLRTIRENASTLKFTTNEFETEDPPRFPLRHGIRVTIRA